MGEKVDKEKDSTKEPKIDLTKLPCWKCEWRYSLHCPHCNWNKDGKVNVY